MPLAALLIAGTVIKLFPFFGITVLLRESRHEIYLVIRWLFIRASYLYVYYLGKCKRFLESHNAREGYILRSKCIFLQIC